jgi:hypothetical protein
MIERKPEKIEGEFNSRKHLKQNKNFKKQNKINIAMCECQTEVNTKSLSLANVISLINDVLDVITQD